MKKHTHTGVYALIQQGNDILFIEKARGPYTGKWDLPGGGFEFGESPEETLKREVMEETAFTVLNYELLNVLSHNVSYENTSNEKETVHHIGVIYRVEVNADNEKIKDFSDGEDSLGAKWISISSINEQDFSPFAAKSLKFISK